MKTFVALLRAVNVGGTGKLPMSDLKAMCEELGFGGVRTYIASGNVVFQSGCDETKVPAMLEHRLHTYVGRPVGVLARDAGELADTLKRNPFPDQPPARTVALFIDEPLGPESLDGVSGRRDEEIRPGRREIYIFYGQGMADSKLRIPAGKNGTARNMNTLTKLAELAAGL